MLLKKNKKEKYIKQKILNWYDQNARKLPWRKKGKRKLPNSYYIFVSEFMLQQTTVSAVIPKFNEFIKIWPSIEKLSKASKSQILKKWAGLGYYARAINLLKSIKIITNEHNGIIPKKYECLIKLPGVGEYTAKAIQGIAYNKSVMPIDSNIERIIIRILGLTKNKREIKIQVENSAKKLISKKNSSSFIQALMDYGSIICLPVIPKCSKCIIQKNCVAYKKNITNKIPIKKNKKKIKDIKFTRAYLIENEFNEILVRRRPAKGMLQSMIEIPNDSWVNNKKNLKKDSFIKKYNFKLSKIKKNNVYSFTHFDLFIESYFTKIKKINFKKYKWLSLKKISNSGLPTVIKMIIKSYNNLN